MGGNTSEHHAKTRKRKVSALSIETFCTYHFGGGKAKVGKRKTKNS